MTSSLSNSPKNQTDSRFIPNLKQLHEVISNLPDVLDYEEEIFTANLLIGSKTQKLIFIKRPIQRGSQLVHRWVYDGKILIRNQDKVSVS